LVIIEEGRRKKEEGRRKKEEGRGEKSLTMSDTAMPFPYPKIIYSVSQVYEVQ
jgi:hypothetical protein